MNTQNETEKWTSKDVVSLITAIAAAVAVIIGAYNGINTSLMKEKQVEIHHLVNATATRQLEDLKSLQAKNDMLQKLLETLGTRLDQSRPTVSPIVSPTVITPTAPPPVEVKVVNPPTQPVPTTDTKPK